MFCKEGKYKDNVTISNVLDNYSCPLYISYMIDTSGETLTSNNINDLIKLSDGLIFETYYYFNHNDILLPGPGFDHGFFYNLVEASQEVGERPTAAFPSSHVGISTIIMIMAYRVNKKLCCFLAPFYVLLCCATVYIQAHYLIDVIAGWVSAVCIYIAATWMYKRWFASVVFQLVAR